jgi:Double-GTPase 2
MTIFWRKITCPFCFKQFKASEVTFRCGNPRCKKEEDHVYAAARGLTSQSMGHVFASSKNGGLLNALAADTKATCGACGQETRKRLCPHCHFELSHDAGLIKDHAIAVIGARGTGKGHYIATLIHRLENELGAQFNFSLRMLGDETRSRFEEDYRTPLLRKGELLQPTQSAVIDSRIKSPMIFRLTLNQHRQAVNLSFFDSAGEDMQSLDVMATEARYICAAAGIIFLLDPLQIDSVRQQIAQSILPTRDFQADPVYIVERLRELFERQNSLRPTQKVKTPVAFVLSKVDTLFSIIDASSALRAAGEHFGHFNLADSQSVHTEIRNYLDSWMGAGFSSRVDSGFAHFHYCGVSSLGRMPTREGRVESLAPLRVEDPFFWLLCRLGLIDGRK